MMDFVGIGFILFWLLGGLFSLAAFAFWIWMLIDCATKEPNEGNDKLIWILIIALTHGVGALIYFLVRRPERIRDYGQ